MALNTPDLTTFPPRSARVRLGGYVILPRLLDKGRAAIQGKNGEYHYNCPLDQRFLSYVGIDATTLKEQLASGKGDWEILDWINTNAKSKRDDVEIANWSAIQESGLRPIWSPASSSIVTISKWAPTAKISRPGSTCWTSTITSPSVGRRNRSVSRRLPGELRKRAIFGRAIPSDLHYCGPKIRVLS